MKIAYCGFDFFVDAIERLQVDGHTLQEVFTFETDDSFNFNRRTRLMASKVGVPISYVKISMADIVRLRDNACDLLLVMGYPFKIPEQNYVRAINLHPTLLPHGRGPFPIPWLILEKPEASGLTLHKIDRSWDGGDILTNISIAVSQDDYLETVCARLQMAAADFVADAVDNFDALWSSSRPQTEDGSYWKATADDWTLPWARGVDAVLRVVRAFGTLESVAMLDGKEWLVTRATGWLEAHGHRPGTLVHRLENQMVVAASDGYVVLLDPRSEVDGAAS